MTQNFSTSELLTYNTIRIKCELHNGEIATGTGFLFRFGVDGDLSTPLLVTNKHVVEGAKVGRLQLNMADSTGKLLPGQHKSFQVDNFEQQWILHPDDNIDLCVMPIGPLINLVRNQGQDVFFVMLDYSLILSDQELLDLNPIEDIVMIGYPNGIWDAVNNAPIVRQGITATHPGIDYEARSEFMIDAACFPGSSGSPVFLFNAGMYQLKLGETVAGNRLKLLGILYAGPQYTATGEIQIVNVPTQQRVVAFSQIPINLGFVIKAKKLLDFEPLIEALIRS